MNRPKELLILGASVFRVAAIKKEVELGYRVLTVDYSPINIGHKCSHECTIANTRDLASVIDATLRHRIDGIFSMASDVALRTLAKVAETRDLPGPDPKIVEASINEDQFRHL